MREIDAIIPLIDALPDLVILVRRDGVVLGHFGGRGVGTLAPAKFSEGEQVDRIWPQAVAAIVKQYVRKAIALRATLDGRFTDGLHHFEMRVSALRPDRAICVIRAALKEDACEGAWLSAVPNRRLRLVRRGYLRRCRDTLASAAIRERPASIAVIELDGVGDIARIVDPKVAEQVLSAALERLPPESPGGTDDSPAWHVGRLSEHLLALVMETGDRDQIQACVARICSSLRDPIAIGDATFHLAAYAGVAVLCQDAPTPQALLDMARTAVAEARRAETTRVQFYTDTMRLRSLARLDIATELRDAIANQDIRLRYVGRYELATGRLVAWVGYLCWLHPLRGEVAPAEFLRVAEATGNALELSRAMLRRVREDFLALTPELDADVRISFGALRTHLLDEAFVDDIGRLLADGVVPADRLELRIAEHSFVAMNSGVLDRLRRLNLRLVVDEVGRGMGSFARLAGAPVWGLQLDRAWVTTLRSDEVALKVCRAGFGAATALGLTPIAIGVDDSDLHQALLDLGCGYGSGDFYHGSGASKVDTLRTAPPGLRSIGARAAGRKPI